jgi:hypothetical protein
MPDQVIWFDTTEFETPLVARPAAFFIQTDDEDFRNALCGKMFTAGSAKTWQ